MITLLEFTKDSIPEEIVNNERKFNEATFFIFHYQKLDVNELLLHYQKYGKYLNVDDYIDNFNRYFDYFNDMKARNRKAFESTYVRKYSKDLYKKIHFANSSLTEVRHMIASIIGAVIREASYICLQNLFQEAYMDFFMKTIQENGLKEFFETFTAESFSIVKKKGFYQKDMIETRLHIYARLHGSYLIEINKEHPDFMLLEKYKNEIKHVLKMNEEEMLIETKKRKHLLDDVLEWNNHAIDQYFDELEKAKSSEPYALLNQSINPADYISTGIDELKVNLPELDILSDENLPIRIQSLTTLAASEDKFQRYFNYLNEENSFKEYMENAFHLL